MATTTTTIAQVREGASTTSSNKQWSEALTGLLFVAPAAIIAFVFQLFPVLYGFFLSMQDGTPLPTRFVGLAQFGKALGSLAYMIGFALALVLSIGGMMLIQRGQAEAQKAKVDFWPYLLPTIPAAPAIIALVIMIFFGDYSQVLWPVVGLAIGIVGYFLLNARNKASLMLLVDSWGALVLFLSGLGFMIYVLAELYSTVNPQIQHLINALTEVLTSPRDKRVLLLAPLTNQFAAWVGIFVSGFLVIVVSRIRAGLDSYEQATRKTLLGLLRVVLVLMVIGLALYNLSAIDLLNNAIVALSKVDPARIQELSGLALKDFVAILVLWPQVSTMLFGMGMIGLAYVMWRTASAKDTNAGMFGTYLIAIVLLVAGWLFVGELPSAAAGGDPKFYDSLYRTVLYAAFTVPVQLVIGLLLAYLLFHEVTWGKSLYRIIFFIPYIAPTVATAAVFAIIFGGDQNGAVNQLFKAMGIPIQQWLRDPRGVVEIIAAGGRSGFSGTTGIPPFLVGPSLPLIVAILYSIWVFSGYNAVIFMSGLGAVPKEMYEAAQVDGAGRWSAFRNITIPLISPTTFFLTLLSIIGTFRAFTHIYVLRTNDQRGALDVATVYIFQIIRDASPSVAYAAALSFILFGIILILTAVQNRLSRDQVFYG